MHFFYVPPPTAVVSEDGSTTEDGPRAADTYRIGQAIYEATGDKEVAKNAKWIAEGVISNADKIRDRLKDVPTHKRYKVFEAVQEVERKRIVGD